MSWTARVNGFTDEGNAVIGNVWKMRDTFGVPLDFVFEELWKHGAVPDWSELYADMLVAGRKRSRVLAEIKAAVVDAGYPKEFEGEVLKRLGVLR